MPYAINGTNITVPPTTGRWVPRDMVGLDGRGHPIYASVREFEMRWDLLAPSEVDQLYTFFQTVETTGTAVVSLPKFGSASWEFHNYSGCALREPEADVYFSEHQTSVVLLVTNIHTVGSE